MAKKPRWHDANPTFDDYDLTLSKTEKKKAMQRLQALGVRLAALSAKKIKELPSDDYFKSELLELDKIKSSTAKKRHIGRIGKLFAEQGDDDVVAIINYLFTASFSPEQQAKIMSWVDRLQASDTEVKPFCKQFGAAEPNSINQQLIWYEHGKQTHDAGLVEVATASLGCYIQQVALLST